MFRYWLDTFHDAFWAAYSSIQDATGIGIFLVLWTVLSLALTRVRKGPEGFQLEMRDLLDGGPALVLACILLLAWHMARVPMRKYEAQVQIANTALKENADLERQVQRRRHNLDYTEPAYENAWAVTQAFMRWRQALGNDPQAALLVTYDKEIRVPTSFLNFAVTGSNIGNQNFLNYGATPEQEEAIEKQATIDAGGKLIFHFASTAKGALTLYDALSSKLYRMDISYEMPHMPHPLPPNSIWLHIGKDVIWTSEYFEKQEQAKTQQK